MISRRHAGLLRDLSNQHIHHLYQRSEFGLHIEEDGPRLLARVTRNQRLEVRTLRASTGAGTSRWESPAADKSAVAKTSGMTPR